MAEDRQVGQKLNPTTPSRFQGVADPLEASLAFQWSPSRRPLVITAKHRCRAVQMHESPHTFEVRHNIKLLSCSNNTPTHRTSSNRGMECMHVPVRHTGQLVQKQSGAGSETDHGAEITRVRRSVVGVCNASGFRRRRLSGA